MESKEIGNIIELKHVMKRYDDNGFVAVHDFNLEVKKGEFVTFLGPSGCGKTTTLRMIAGFELPTDGEILLNGKSITNLPPYERPINTVFQRYALFPHMNIYDNIAFGLKQKKLPKEEIDRKVKRILKLVDLEGFEDRSVSTLSGGQQQRIAIGRALVNEPEILLLDEPLGALDLKMRQEMQIELKAMHDRLGITFIYVTHDQEEALTMSDKIVVMSEGTIQQIGTPEDIYNEPKNIFVADFVGDSNIFSGIMTGDKRVRFCGGEFECLDEFPQGTHIMTVVRPEDVELVRPEDGIIQAEVTSVIFKGMHYEITMQAGRNEIVSCGTKSAAVGDRVGITLDPDGIHVIKAEDNTNTFRVDVTRDFGLEYNGETLADSQTLLDLFPGSKQLEDGSIVDTSGSEIDFDRYRIYASIQPGEIDMTDNQEEGLEVGNINNLIYEGDHYLYVIHTESEQDFAVYDEDLWNMGDRVGLIIPVDKLMFSVVKK